MLRYDIIRLERVKGATLARLAIKDKNIVRKEKQNLCLFDCFDVTALYLTSVVTEINLDFCFVLWCLKIFEIFDLYSKSNYRQLLHACHDEIVLMMLLSSF